MRKTAVTLLIVLTGGLAAASLSLHNKLQHSRGDYAILQSDEQAMRNRYGAAINEIAAIQDSLNAIVLGDEGVKQLQTQLDAERSLSQERGDEAMARIAALKAGIERTKDRIAELDEHLKASGVRIAGLEKMVRNLKKTVVEREDQIAQLGKHVDELQTQVTGLTTQVEEGQETIHTQEVVIEEGRREMGTVFYTIASKHDLEEAGVIVAKGGVLGFGRTYEPSGQFDDSRFASLDTDQESIIPIRAENAKVLSDQPPTSYELVRVGDEMELHILDPKIFRTVKHVVIMTT